jgi:hypothetical protein
LDDLPEQRQCHLSAPRIAGPPFSEQKGLICEMVNGPNCSPPSRTPLPPRASLCFDLRACQPLDPQPPESLSYAVTICNLRVQCLLRSLHKQSLRLRYVPNTSGPREILTPRRAARLCKQILGFEGGRPVRRRRVTGVQSTVVPQRWAARVRTDDT